MHEKLVRVAAYLKTLEASIEFEPKKLGNLLPHVFVLEIEAGEGDPKLRVRLTGSELDRAFGRLLKGSYLDAFIHGPRGGEVLDGFRHCAKTREALWMRQVVHIEDKAPRSVEGVLVHLSPSRIYGALIFGAGAATMATVFERRPLFD